MTAIVAFDVAFLALIRALRVVGVPSTLFIYARGSLVVSLLLAVLLTAAARMCVDAFYSKAR